MDRLKLWRLIPHKHIREYHHGIPVYFILPRRVDGLIYDEMTSDLCERCGIRYEETFKR